MATKNEMLLHASASIKQTCLQQTPKVHVILCVLPV